MRKGKKEPTNILVGQPKIKHTSHTTGKTPNSCDEKSCFIDEEGENRVATQNKVRKNRKGEKKTGAEPLGKGKKGENPSARPIGEEKRFVIALAAGGNEVGKKEG